MSYTNQNEMLTLYYVHMKEHLFKIDEYRHHLSSEEVAKSDSLISSLDRSRYIISHFALRAILSAKTGFPPKRISYIENNSGKPSLASKGKLQNGYFNLTHSEDLAAIAVTEIAPVGVDVERIRDGVEHRKLATMCFPIDIADQIASLPHKQGLLAFYREWVRMEAGVKALGTGLSTYSILTKEHNQYKTAGNKVTLIDLTTPDGYYGAIALNKQDCQQLKPRYEVWRP